MPAGYLHGRPTFDSGKVVHSQLNRLLRQRVRMDLCLGYELTVTDLFSPPGTTLDGDPKVRF